MDAVKALRQIHKEFTECTLCTDQYESPKMLPCQHTFCLRCLESYGVGKKIGEAVACPVCRQEFVLQKGGFSALPNNFNTNRIIELQKSFEKTHDDAKWCHMCKDDEKEGAVCMTPATGYCSSCSKGVCKECASKHTKDGHTVEIAAAVLSPNSTAKPFSGLCSEHSGELLKLFCVECSTVVCVKCFCRSHNTHKCCDIEEAAEKFGVELEAQLKTMRVTASKMKHLTDRYSRKIQLFSENTERMEHAIKETAEKLKRSVDASKTALIRELKEKTEPTLAQMRNYKKLLDERSLTINCLLDESEKAKSSGNPVKIIKLSNKIKTDVAGFDIPSSSGEAIQKQYYFFPASFNSSSTPAKSLVGCIIECDAGKAQQLSSCHSRHLLHFDVVRTGGIQRSLFMNV